MTSDAQIARMREEVEAMIVARRRRSRLYLGAACLFSLLIAPAFANGHGPLGVGATIMTAGMFALHRVTVRDLGVGR